VGALVDGLAVVGATLVDGLAVVGALVDGLALVAGRLAGAVEAEPDDEVPTCASASLRAATCATAASADCAGAVGQLWIAARVLAKSCG